MKKPLVLTLTIFSLLQANAQNWDEVIKAVASDRDTIDYFGYSVSISGDYAIVGAYNESEDDTGGNTIMWTGSAYLIERDGNGNWTQVQKIVASDRGINDLFGYSVSINGDYAIVGAYREDHDSNGGNVLNSAGSAYIFERDGSGNWAQVQKVVASDRTVNGDFGWAVSINGDYAIVGAGGDGEDIVGGNFLQWAGSAYIFERNGGGNWNQVQKIVASDRGSLDHFGWSVSISGNYAVIGVSQEDEDTSGGNTLSAAGSSYVFERDSAGSWDEVQKIVASDREAYDFFGSSVSISGNHCIVGAVQEGHDATGSNFLILAGSAYIFERNGSGNWDQGQKIVAPDREGLDYFGWSVSMSGNYLIVGARDEDEDSLGGNSISRAGSAYIFDKDVNGTWNFLQKIVASDRAIDDWFGHTVAISDNHAIVGAYQEDTDTTGGNIISNAGSVFLFETLCIATSETIDPIACDSYVSPSSNFTWTTSGTYIDTIANTSGCDSIITRILTINTVDTSVTQLSNTLTSNDSGAVYQWLDCNNDHAAISGETAQSFMATVNGDYAVAVTKDSCVDTSACYSITGLGIIENNLGSSLIIYPNPTTGWTTIDLGATYSKVTMTIRNLNGQMVDIKNFEICSQLNFEIEGANAYYFIEINTVEGRSALLRVLKEVAASQVK